MVCCRAGNYRISGLQCVSVISRRRPIRSSIMMAASFLTPIVEALPRTLLRKTLFPIFQHFHSHLSSSLTIVTRPINRPSALSMTSVHIFRTASTLWFGRGSNIEWGWHRPDNSACDDKLNYPVKCAASGAFITSLLTSCSELNMHDDVYEYGAAQRKSEPPIGIFCGSSMVHRVDEGALQSSQSPASASGCFPMICLRNTK